MKGLLYKLGMRFLFLLKLTFTYDNIRTYKPVIQGWAKVGLQFEYTKQHYSRTIIYYCVIFYMNNCKSILLTPVYKIPCVYIFKGGIQGLIYVYNKEIMLIVVLLRFLQYIQLYSQLSLCSNSLFFLVFTTLQDVQALRFILERP